MTASSLWIGQKLLSVYLRSPSARGRIRNHLPRCGRRKPQTNQHSKNGTSCFRGCGLEHGKHKHLTSVEVTVPIAV